MTEVIEVPLDPEIQKVRDEWEAGAYDREVLAVQRLREQAYRDESDILKYKWEETLDEADHAAFLASKSAIRERYPYPEPPKGK